MSPSFESFTILSQAVAVHVRERNPKGTPAVLFLHGWLDHSHTFDWVLEHLPDVWRLILSTSEAWGAASTCPWAPTTPSPTTCSTWRPPSRSSS